MRGEMMNYNNRIADCAGRTRKTSMRMKQEKKRKTQQEHRTNALRVAPVTQYRDNRTLLSL